MLLSALPTQEWLFGRPTIDLKRIGELIGTNERKSSGANFKKSLKLNTLSSGLHLPASNGAGEGWGGDAHSSGCDNDETVGSGCRAGYQGA